MSLLRMMTLCPACAIFCAAKRPAGPAPTTNTVFKRTPPPLRFVVASFAESDALKMPKFPLLPLVDMTGIVDRVHCAVRDSRHNDSFYAGRVSCVWLLIARAVSSERRSFLRYARFAMCAATAE